MKRVLIFLVLCGFVFCFALSGEIVKEKKGAAVASAYPDTSKDYRGVVAIDADVDSHDELFCDFGSNGVWYCKGYNWTKLNAANPDFILGFQYAGTDYVLCDFGSSGLWYWGYGSGLPGQFIKISIANVNDAFVTDDDNDGSDEIHLFFGSNGLWRYDMGGSTKLTKLHATAPDIYGSLRSDLWTSGWEEGALAFGSDGFWTYDGSWYKINATEPDYDNISANVEATSANEELICDYWPNGTWLYDGSSWHKVHSLDPCDTREVRFEGAPDYEVLVEFNTVSGLWMWNYSGYPGSWTKISANDPDCDEGFCEPFDPNGNTEGNGDQEVAVDFDTGGLWLYDYSTNGWTKINSNNPSFMVRCDWYSDGYDTALVVDFGSVGLWLYDGRYNLWHKLSNFSPDGPTD